jgi:hypothetical protein
VESGGDASFSPLLFRTWHVLKFECAPRRSDAGRTRHFTARARTEHTRVVRHRVGAMADYRREEGVYWCARVSVSAVHNPVRV